MQDIFNPVKIWFTSDTHFCHKNIIKYEDRPFPDTETMNSEIIKRWNSVVGPDDVVYHLGDVALGPADRFYSLVSALNGRKILIRGNHDGKSKEWYLEHGFDAVYPALMLFAQGKRIMLTHNPRDMQYDDYDLHFYGHVHSKGFHGEYPTVARNGACVCVERWDYHPVGLDDLIYLCAKAPMNCPNI